MARVKVLTGKHRSGDRVYTPGEVFEATEAELAAFGDKLKLVQEEAEVEISPTDETPVEETSKPVVKGKKG